MGCRECTFCRIPPDENRRVPNTHLRECMGNKTIPQEVTGEIMNANPLPPLKIRSLNPSARLVPARVLSAEYSASTIRIQLKKV
jgi:hypothetical protein